MSFIEETRDELLGESLNSRDVDRARKFLSGCATSTLALRALMAVMCELEQMAEATALEAALPTIALAEATALSVSEEEVAS